MPTALVVMRIFGGRRKETEREREREREKRELRRWGSYFRASVQGWLCRCGNAEVGRRNWRNSGTETRGQGPCGTCGRRNNEEWQINMFIIKFQVYVGKGELINICQIDE